MFDNLEDLGMRKFVCFEGLDRFTIDRVQWITADGQRVIGRPVEYTRRERAWMQTSFADPDRRRRLGRDDDFDEDPPIVEDATGTSSPAAGDTDDNAIRFEATGRNGTMTREDWMRWAELGARPHCPVGHLLPPDFDKRATLVYGLVGQSGAGKSQEVAVLGQVIRRGKGLGAYHLVVELSPYSQQHYTDEYWWYPYSGTPHKVAGIACRRRREGRGGGRHPSPTGPGHPAGIGDERRAAQADHLRAAQHRDQRVGERAAVRPLG